MIESMIETRTRLHRFILHRVRDPAIADGILQESLMRALANQHSVRAPGALTGWLFRIATNLVMDHFRESGLLRVLSEDIPQPEEERDAMRELADCVRPLVSVLPDPYRKAVELSELEGLPHKAIALRLGIGISGVKSRVQRGRRLLLERLERCCAFEKGVRGIVDYRSRTDDCGNCGA